jgi:hypothetical protein
MESFQMLRLVGGGEGEVEVSHDASPKIHKVQLN